MLRTTFIHSGEFSEEQFAQARPLLQPVIEQAARGEFTVDDLEQMTRDGRAVTGIAHSGEKAVMAMSFEILRYPRKTVVNIMALGGENLSEVAAEFWHEFRAWSRSAGAEAIEACCSDAMARILRAHGFTTQYRLVRVNL